MPPHAEDALPLAAPDIRELLLQARLRRLLPFCFFASFAALGAFVPFLALMLKARGIDAALLALTLGALPVGRLLAGPAWSVAADRFQAPRLVLRLAAVVAVLGCAAVAFGPLPTVALATLLYAVGRAPMGPVVDSLALRAVGGDQDTYALLRLWGSVGFLVSTLGSSWLLEHHGVDPLLVSLGFSVVLAVLLWGLPPVDRVAPTPIGPALRALGRDPVMLGLCGAAILHFSVHIATTSFLAVHLQELGVPATWAGTALALGVGVEVFVLMGAPWLFRRFGAEALFVAAMALAVPRWVGMAWATEAWVVVAFQALHGFTFGAFWVSGVALVARRSRKEVAHSGQALFAASVGGVGALLGSVGGSFLEDAWGTRAIFEAGIGLSVAATLVALWTVRRSRRGVAL